MNFSREKYRDRLLDNAGKLNQEVPRPSTLQIATLVLLAIPAFFLRKYFVAFSLMILTVALSLAVNRFDANRLGIELATFSTVTMGTIFGPRIGAALGFIYIMLQIFSGSTPGIYMMWVVPAYTVLGYFVGNFSGMDIVQLGIYASVVVQSFFVFMTFVTSRSRLPKFIQYVMFNLTFNFFLFQSFAKPLLGLIGAQ